MANILRQHKTKQSTGQSGNMGQGKWHSNKVLARWRKARNKRNAVAAESRRRNRS